MSQEEEEKTESPTPMANSSNDDAIGDTIYSKRWLIACLLQTVQFVQSESQSPGNDNEDTGSLDIGDIEEQLCILWDISDNEHVQQLLLANEVPDIFMSCALKTNSPRLAEICLAILANCAHNERIRQQICGDISFCTSLLSFLSSSDIPFLTQVLRLINTLEGREQTWLESLIKFEGSNFFSDVQYLLLNCLNVDSLKLLFQLLNQLLYHSNDTGALWLRQDERKECVLSLCQACSQILTSIEVSQDFECGHSNFSGISHTNCDFFFQFWFIIQLLYSTEWNSAFENCIRDLKELFLRYEHMIENGSESNSLLSYCAASLFFQSIFNQLKSIEQKNDPSYLVIKSVKDEMTKSDTVAATLRRAIRLCETYDGPMKTSILDCVANLYEFECMLSSQEKV